MKAAGNVNENTRIGTIPTIPTANGTESAPPSPTPAPFERPDFGALRHGQEIGLNLSYTINLNLPPSTDPEVFNAIFKALKENLLGR